MSRPADSAYDLTVVGVGLVGQEAVTGAAGATSTSSPTTASGGDDAAAGPSPPLLCRQLTGRGAVVPELQTDRSEVTARLLCDDPEVIVIIGPADVTEVWETDTWLNPSVFAPQSRAPRGSDRLGRADGPARNERWQRPAKPEGTLLPGYPGRSIRRGSGAYDPRRRTGRAPTARPHAARDPWPRGGLPGRYFPTPWVRCRRPPRSFTRTTRSGSPTLSRT